jgi:predicted transcriptional regulator
MSQDASATTPPEIETRAREIHSALSNGDSLRIFNLAADGIDASTSVLQKHQFTKKRYYGRLKELVDLGLIIKENGEYRHTELGNLIFENQVKNLEQILLGKNSAEARNDSKNMTSYSRESGNLPEELITNLESSTGAATLKPARFFDSWNELSMHVAIKIETAKKEIYVATRYVDFRTADSALRVAKRGCKVNILHSNRNGLSTKLQLMGNLMTHPKALSVFKELTANPNVVLREATIPFSFLVIDDKTVGIEIVNPEDPYSFFFGLEFDHEDLAKKLVSHFSEMSRNAERDTIASIIESSTSLETQPRSQIVS